MTSTADQSAGRYAPVNGLKLYYEVHGTGRPLVLLHGGLLTSDLSFHAVLPALATSHQVIAVELQGHGHTADIDREPTISNLAEDVIALLDHLGIERAAFFGFSLGGLTALEAAMRHPERVERLILASVHFRADGYHEEITDQEAHPDSIRMPTASDFAQMQEAYERVAPDPGHFGAFAEKMSAVIDAFQGWPVDRLRGVAARTLLMIGDTDFVRIDHAAEMQELIPDAQLAVVPAATHNGLLQRADIVIPTVEAFLAQS